MAARPVGTRYIVPENPQDSYREFMLEFQDMQLAYASKDDYPILRPIRTAAPFSASVRPC